MKLPDPDEEPTVSVERAGEVLDLCRNSAYAGVKAGEIPSIRIGRSIRVPTAALLRMIHRDDASVA